MLTTVVKSFDHQGFCLNLCKVCHRRKNVGYLWAIAHGAKLIYETDDDNLLTTTDIAVLPSPGTHAVYQTTNATVNVYSHFRQANLWCDVPLISA